MAEENITFVEPTGLGLPWDEGSYSYVDCDEGWHPLIKRLDAKLKEIIPDYTVIQVKEKFAGLRYYTYLNYESELVTNEKIKAFNQAIAEAEDESLRTC